MPTPSAQFGLPQIAGTDSPDIPRDLNAVIARFEALRNTYATRQVRDVGDPGQLRAGRPLTVADFTVGLGLATPILLANLTTLAGAGSNLGSGGNLVNKGAVPNAPGIMGAAGEAAQFVGATGQALYIADTGAADPFRIRTGSAGCWFRTAKRGLQQTLLAKWGLAGQNVFNLWVTTGNVVEFDLSSTGAPLTGLPGSADVADDRWHFAVATIDGTRVKTYVDGALETNLSFAATLFGGSSPLNIGSSAADAATAAVLPHYGRVDEAFVTADVLSEDQIRYLYCASLAHTLPNVPTSSGLSVRRQKRGAALASADFPSAPVRLHNFAGGALTDEGSGGVALTANPGTGAIVTVAAPDGVRDGAYSFSGAHTGLSATDAGLPAALAARSYGGWLRTASLPAMNLMGWGTYLTADARLATTAAGAVQAASGADAIAGSFIADGLPHHIVVVEDNAAADGVKRKLYVDARLVVGSTVMNTLTLAGANSFRVGASSTGAGPFIGQASRAFVYAGALTPEQVRALYNKGSQALAPSPRAPGDHVEAFEATRALVVFDALEQSDLVDFLVTA